MMDWNEILPLVVVLLVQEITSDRFGDCNHEERWDCNHEERWDCNHEERWDCNHEERWDCNQGMCDQILVLVQE
jgi:hypothetical protein